MKRSRKLLLVCLVVGAFAFPSSSFATNVYKTLASLAHHAAEDARGQLEETAKNQEKAVNEAKKKAPAEQVKSEEQHLRNYKAQLKRLKDLEAKLAKLKDAAKQCQ